MATKVDIAPLFVKELRRLAKKFPKVITQVEGLIAELQQDERPGDKIPQVGYDVYKVRLANPSAARGKSGGFRVIYYVQMADHVALLTIYSKTDQADISPQAIQAILQDLTPSADTSDDENS